MENVPSYLTSPAEALSRAEKLEQLILDAADSALAAFLEKVVNDAADGQIARGDVVGYWLTALGRALAHPTFAAVRADLLTELELAPFADDAYTAAEMTLETAHNMGATADERRELLTALFQHPTPGLIASLSEKLDGWLRRRISRMLLNRLGKLGPDDLTREDLVGREFEIPTSPGSSTLVTEDEWREDDRPGVINWRARMQRDIRTAYTAIFGRQIQYQLERYGFPQKKWVSRKDDRVRASHVHADGDVVGLYATFTVGLAQLRYPGDPLGPAGEIISCRCVLVGAGTREP